VGANSAQLYLKGVELWSILSQISLPWQRGSIFINDTVKLVDPENHTIEQKLRLYLIHSRSYDGLKHCHNFLIGAIVIVHIFCEQNR